MSEMDDLAAFAVLIDAGSFTLAAQQLGCSKGQLSKRISLLEAQFSVVLLHRTTRRLSLTAAGPGAGGASGEGTSGIGPVERRYGRPGAHDGAGILGRNLL